MNQQDSTATLSKVYTDFKGALSGIAEALKVGAEHVYEILVRQQVANSVVYLLIFIFSFVFLYIFYKGAINKDEEWSDCGDPTAIGIFKFLSLIVGVIMLGFGIIHFDVIVMGFINPEYGAIMEIKSFIK